MAFLDGSIRFRTDRLSRPRLRRRSQLRLPDLLEQQPDGAVEDLTGITVRDLTAQERLQAPKGGVGLLADGELNPVSLRGRGLDNWTRSGDPCRRWSRERGGIRRCAVRDRGHSQCPRRARG